MRVYHCILLPILCTMLSGCAAGRKSVSSSAGKYEAIEQTDLRIEQTRQTVTDSLSRELSVTEQVTEEVTETFVFDTSRPDNPQTGIPPLQSKTVSTSRTITRAATQQTAEAWSGEVMMTTLQDSTRTQSSLENYEHTETVKEPGRGKFLWGVWIGGLIVVIIIIAFLIIRHKIKFR